MGNLIQNDKESLNFGDYTLEEKEKDKLELNGDIYNVKSFYEITRLEKNDVLIYESVPGTSVKNFVDNNEGISFEVYGNTTASIILGVKEGINYKLNIDGKDYKDLKFISKGKLNINVDFYDKDVKIVLSK